MKCTYRFLILTGGALCLLLLLTFSQDVTKILAFRHAIASPESTTHKSQVIPCNQTSSSMGPKVVVPEPTLGKTAKEEAGPPQLPSNPITTTNLTPEIKPTQIHHEVLKLSDSGKKELPSQNRNPRMVLSVVCCGERVNETRVMLKSAAALSHSTLKMIVFTEDNYKPVFNQMYQSWPRKVQERITLELHSITFPPGQDAQAWRKLFKPCASQRLFMPSLLKEEDALVYVDTDVLFLAPLEELWKHFDTMNSSHMAAMAPEHEDLATGWYNRFAKHPYYGRLGVNSGVMLMNLTRLRQFGWEEYVVPIYKHYKLAITWGDQDIINIIFHYHPDKLYVYGCEYNLRPDHCMYMSVCKSAERRGVFVLHGNRGTFHTDKQLAFKAVYRAWEEYELGEDLRQNLYYPMQRYLLKVSNTNCGRIHTAYLKALGSIVRLR